jgi:hypothetical protein
MEGKMVRRVVYSTHRICFVYHGSTTIERVRKEAGRVLFRDWLLFDSVEEAEEYFNTDCGD